MIEKDVNLTMIYSMRQSGASLQEIGDRIGRTRERVRQILNNRFGSTKHRLISTEQLCKMTGLSRSKIMQLYLDGIIIPEVKRITGYYHFCLWSPSVVKRISGTKVPLHSN